MMADSVTDEFPVLCERKVKFRPKSGGELVDVVVQFGYPKWVEENIVASCPVAFRGGIGRVRDIRGADPMNAIRHALTFIETYMQRDEGEGQFFWHDGEKYLSG